jgi:hypothetical protein
MNELGIGRGTAERAYRSLPRIPTASRLPPDTFHRTYRGPQRMRALSRNQVFLGNVPRINAAPVLSVGKSTFDTAMDNPSPTGLHGSSGE